MQKKPYFPDKISTLSLNRKSISAILTEMLTYLCDALLFKIAIDQELWHLYKHKFNIMHMFHYDRSIQPLERLILLVADPLINGLFLYLPLLVIIYPVFFFGFMSYHAFMKCNFFLYAATYLNKDIAGGRSLAKRFMGYAVVKESDSRPPRMATCFLRNVTFLIYIVELLFGLFSTSQKTTDYFTKTRIIKKPKDPQPIASFYNGIKNITYNDETREVIGLTVLLFLFVLLLK